MGRDFRLPLMATSTTGEQTEGGASEPTLAEVASRAGVSAPTVRRWVKEGLIPQYDGSWTPAAVAQGPIVGRLREGGHTIEQIRRASESGPLATHVPGTIAPQEGRYTLRQAAREAEIDEQLIERIYMSLGLSTLSVDSITEEDMEMLRYIAAMLTSGLPEVAFLQLARVYGQTLPQIADAEVRLIHIYVHEPMMREGIPGVQ